MEVHTGPWEQGGWGSGQGPSNLIGLSQLLFCFKKLTVVLRIKSGGVFKPLALFIKR